VIHHRDVASANFVSVTQEKLRKKWKTLFSEKKKKKPHELLSDWFNGSEGTVRFCHEKRIQLNFGIKVRCCTYGDF